MPSKNLYLLLIALDNSDVGTSPEGFLGPATDTHPPVGVFAPTVGCVVGPLQLKMYFEFGLYF